MVWVAPIPLRCRGPLRLAGWLESSGPGGGLQITCLLPRALTQAFKEYEYKMVRILDKNGKVNQGAINRLKKIYGPNLIVFKP